MLAVSGCCASLALYITLLLALQWSNWRHDPRWRRLAAFSALLWIAAIPFLNVFVKGKSN